MTGHVTLLPATVPAHLREAGSSRVREFNDDSSAEGARYRYAVRGSGSLVVWRQDDSGHAIETVFGPSAWEEVEGDTSTTVE